MLEFCNNNQSSNMAEETLHENPITTEEMELSLKALRALNSEAKFEFNKQAQIFSTFKKTGLRHLRTLDSQNELKERFKELKDLIQNQLKNTSRNNGKFDLETYIQQLRKV